MTEVENVSSVCPFTPLDWYLDLMTEAEECLFNLSHLLLMMMTKVEEFLHNSAPLTKNKYNGISSIYPFVPLVLIRVQY